MDITIDQAAERAKMSPTTWGRVELGKPVRGLNLAKVDRVLGWLPGASKDFFDHGKEPGVNPALTLPPRANAEPTTSQLIAETEEDLIAMEEELDRRLRVARRDRTQLAEVVQRLREIQDAGDGDS